MKLFILILSIASVALGVPTRIVGGQNAAKNQFSYQVAFSLYGQFFCGGSILDNTTILTAAHCLKATPYQYIDVYVGNNELNKQIEKYQIEKTIIPNYDPQTSLNDVGIVKLTTAIKFSESVQPVALRKTNIGANEEVVLSGWGDVYKGSVTPNHLQFIHLKTIAVDDCSQRLITANRLVTDAQICTLTNQGEGACNGDSGGPLVDTNGEQIGVVSWGFPCALGLPDVYSRVYSQLEWIENNRY